MVSKRPVVMKEYLLVAHGDGAAINAQFEGVGLGGEGKPREEQEQQG